MASQSKLHIVMFPWPAFGHMIPFLELSKFIALKGHKVSFISTTRNINRLPKLPPNLSPLINFVKLTLPKIDQLPVDAEATMDISTDQIDHLKSALDGLETELTRFLENNLDVDWVILDFVSHWLPPITAKHGISSAFFSIISAWFIANYGPSRSMIDGSDPRKKLEDFTVVPDWVPFPSNVAYRTHEARWMLASVKSNASGFTDAFRLGSTIFGCDAIFVRQSLEFEPDWLDLLGKLHGKPVISVGLMPPMVHNSVDDKNDTWVTINEWLERKNRDSVVYVALGSEVSLSQDQLNELALGLELSGLPFFWALRKPTGSTESDSVELPDGFEFRTKDRGIVWKNWAPQLKILAHDSVGGFLTHCGWSSIIEGVMFGRPLIMLPFLVDQGLNSRVLEKNKVGIEIPRDERDGSFTRASVAESLSLVMVDKDGMTYRDRAKEMKVIFEDRDRHDRYIESFIGYLETQRHIKKDLST